MTEIQFIESFNTAYTRLQEYSHVRITVVYKSGYTMTVEGRLESLYFHDECDDDGVACYFCIKGETHQHITLDINSVAAIHFDYFDK